LPEKDFQALLLVKVCILFKVIQCLCEIQNNDETVKLENSVYIILIAPRKEAQILASAFDSCREGARKTILRPLKDVEKPKAETKQTFCDANRLLGKTRKRAKLHKCNYVSLLMI
jgi:hypothetical protein